MAAVAAGMAVAAATSPQPRKLRVGVFADGALQPRWIVEALARLAASDFAEVTLAEVGDAEPSTGAAWRLYGALDRRVFGGYAEERISLRSLSSGSSSDLDVALAL